MPEVTTNATQNKERDFELKTVPMNKRKGFLAMFVVMLGFTFFSASMWTGATLGNGQTLTDFVLAVLAGNLILGVYTAVLAYIAADTGLSVHLLAHRSFGRRGSVLPSFLLAFTQIGWFGVGVAMFAIPVQKYLEQQGIACNIWLPVLLGGILMTSSAYFGITALTVISIVAVPLIAVGGCFSSVKVFLDDPNAWNALINFKPDSANALTLSAAIALTVGSFISGGTCTPDFVRFAKNKKIAVSTTAIAFFIGNSLMFIFGAIGGMFFNTNDISNVLVAQGLLIPGIIVLGLNIWTTNDNALYTSGLGLSNITGLPKKYLVIFNGLLGTVLAVYLYNNFCGFLGILNTTLPSIGAILISDHFLVRKIMPDENETPALGFPAILAWACGVSVANFIPWGISSINGILTAFAFYPVFVLLFLRKKGGAN